jgi:hypothetical protein
MADFKIDLNGSKELMAFFDDLPKKFTDQVLGDISQAGASVIRSEARRKMPVDGELGQIGKKAVIIKRDRYNKTIRAVTLGGQLIGYKGRMVSIGKIIRHMSAGRQSLRKSKRGQQRGRVQIRGGDFIQSAFLSKKEEAIKRMGIKSAEIIKRRAARLFHVS